MRDVGVAVVQGGAWVLVDVVDVVSELLRGAIGRWGSCKAENILVVSVVGNSLDRSMWIGLWLCG